MAYTERKEYDNYILEVTDGIVTATWYKDTSVQGMALVKKIHALRLENEALRVALHERDARELAAIPQDVFDEYAKTAENPSADELLGRTYTPSVTPAVTGRLCACGCGRPVAGHRADAKYASAACRVRAHRAAAQEQGTR
jgi:hypothetical protein